MTNKRRRAGRPIISLELENARAALSVLRKSAEWKRWPAERRFEHLYLTVSGPVLDSPCHHWLGTITSEGYGYFMVRSWRNGQRGQAHHFALEHAGFGPIEGRRVYHRCANTACVNVNHLSFDPTSFTWDDPVTAPQLADVDIPRRAAARFWTKIDKKPDGTCWWWTGAITGPGYGRFTIRAGWATDAHRMAYALARGFIPDGLCVCHGPDCDESGGAGRLCVNPDHLIADTHDANMRDKNGGHYRRSLSKIPVSPERRRLMVEFLPHSIAALKGQGDLDAQASMEEMLALDAAIDHDEQGTLNAPVDTLQPA